MKIIWDEDAWEEYLFWQNTDKKTLKRINTLIKDMQRNPYCGLGKTERLKGDLSGYMSRRIDEYNRIVYAVEEDAIVIISCKDHYE